MTFRKRYKFLAKKAVHKSIRRGYTNKTRGIHEETEECSRLFRNQSSHEYTSTPYGIQHVIPRHSASNEACDTRRGPQKPTSNLTLAETTTSPYPRDPFKPQDPGILSHMHRGTDSVNYPTEAKSRRIYSAGVYRSAGSVSPPR